MIEDYQKQYSNIIEKGKLRGLDKNKLDGYYEKHHIIPRCMGGLDEDSNYVLLTCYEHILAYNLLTKIYPDLYGLQFAIIQMIPSRLTWDKLTEEEMKEIAIIRENLQINQKRKVDIDGSLDRYYWKKNLSKISITRMENSDLRKQISNTIKSKKDKTPFIQRRRKVGDKFGNIFDSVDSCAKFYGFKSGVSISNKIKNGTDKFYYIEEKKSGIKIQGPDGKLYSSLRECSEETGHSRKSIRNWIKNKPEKGYKIIE